MEESKVEGSQADQNEVIEETPGAPDPVLEEFPSDKSEAPVQDGPESPLEESIENHSPPEPAESREKEVSLPEEPVSCSKVPIDLHPWLRTKEYSC